MRTGYRLTDRSESRPRPGRTDAVRHHTVHHRRQRPDRGASCCDGRSVSGGGSGTVVHSARLAAPRLHGQDREEGRDDRPDGRIICLVIAVDQPVAEPDGLPVIRGLPRCDGVDLLDSPRRLPDDLQVSLDDLPPTAIVQAVVERQAQDLLIDRANGCLDVSRPERRVRVRRRSPVGSGRPLNGIDPAAVPSPERDRHRGRRLPPDPVPDRADDLAGG